MTIENVKKCLSTTIANEYTMVHLKVEDVQELLALLKAAEEELEKYKIGNEFGSKAVTEMLQTIKDLEAENEQLGEWLAHWMGEGEPKSPEDIEYCKLISKKRSDEENKRLRKLIQIITEQGLEWWKRKYYQLKTNTTKQALNYCKQQFKDFKAENERLKGTRKCGCGEDIFFYTHCPRCRRQLES